MFELIAKDLVKMFGMDLQENTVGYGRLLRALNNAFEQGIAAQALADCKAQNERHAKKYGRIIMSSKGR